MSLASASLYALSPGCSAISDFDYGFGGQPDGGASDGGLSGGSGAGASGSGATGGGGAGASGSGAGGTSGTDGGVLPPSPPSAVFEVGAAGEMSSPRHRLRVAIGAPQPMGSASSSRFGVRLGPFTGVQ